MCIQFWGGFGVQKLSSQHLIPVVRQDGCSCEFLMRLVSANLFAQPKHLWIQNLSCHQSGREMMSGENPFVSLGISPWHATKLQMWTLALSSTGKIYSEISLGQQLLLNYMANSKERIWLSDSLIFQKAGRIRAIWNLRLKWVSCDCIAPAEPLGLEGIDVFLLPACWSVQHLLLVPAMQESELNTATWSLNWEVSEMILMLGWGWKEIKYFRDLYGFWGRKSEITHLAVEDKSLRLATYFLTLQESTRSAGRWFGLKKSLLLPFT